MPPLFSVIVPTMGRPEALERAIASILVQTIDDFEIVVVNDGGAELHERSKDPRIRVVQRGGSSGPAAARNRGIDAAVGRYVTFLDDDDRLLPERLALAHEGLAASPIAICEADGRPLRKLLRLPA